MPAVSVDVRISGMEKVNASMERINQSFRSLTPSEFGDMVVAKARAELSKHYIRSRAAQRTGKLEAGITKRMEGGAVVINASALSETGFDYASVVENGRPAMTSYMKKMRFIGREGHPVWTHYVSGTVPKQYMASARAWANEFFAEYMRRRVHRIVNSNGTSSRVPAPNINASSLSAFIGKPIGSVRSASLAGVLSPRGRR